MRFEVFSDIGGNSWWRLIGGNGRNVATSGEGFFSKSDATEAAERFRANALRYTFMVYADRSGHFRWRATSPNVRTVASSGEAFDSRSNAQRAADNVQANAGSATGP